MSAVADMRGGLELLLPHDKAGDVLEQLGRMDLEPLPPLSGSPDASIAATDSSASASSRSSSQSGEQETRKQLVRLRNHERVEHRRLLARLHAVTQAALRLGATLPNPTARPSGAAKQVHGGVFDAERLGTELNATLELEREQICSGPTVLLGLWDSRYRRVITHGSGAFVNLDSLDRISASAERPRRRRGGDSRSPAAKATELLRSGTSPLIVTAAHVVYPLVSRGDGAQGGAPGLRRRYAQPQGFHQRILVGLPRNDRETAWRFEARVVPLEGTGFCHGKKKEFVDIIVLELTGELQKAARLATSPRRPARAMSWVSGDGDDNEAVTRPLRPVMVEELKWDPMRGDWEPGPVQELEGELETRITRLALQARTTPGEPVDFFGYGQTELNPSGPLNGLTSARGAVKASTVRDEFENATKFRSSADSPSQATKGDADAPRPGETLQVYEGKVTPAMRVAAEEASERFGWVPIEFEEPEVYADVSRKHHVNVTIADHGHGMSGGPVCNHSNHLVAVFSCHTTYVRSLDVDGQKHMGENSHAEMQSASTPLERCTAAAAGSEQRAEVAVAEAPRQGAATVAAATVAAAKVAKLGLEDAVRTSSDPKPLSRTASVNKRLQKAVEESQQLRLHVTEGHGVKLTSIIEPLRELKRVRDALRQGLLKSDVQLARPLWDQPIPEDGLVRMRLSSAPSITMAPSGLDDIVPAAVQPMMPRRTQSERKPDPEDQLPANLIAFD